MSTIHKIIVNTIFSKADLKPHKLTYHYYKSQDPGFDSKMHNILLIYKQFERQFDDNEKLIVSDDIPVHMLSYDKKPGMQAIATTVPDLISDKKHPTVNRDYECKRLGTPLLTAIDLQTGETIPLVRDKHNS